jgi:uncharacterized protein involved in exopolysaccharide biosynthesis
MVPAGLPRSRTSVTRTKGRFVIATYLSILRRRAGTIALTTLVLAPLAFLAMTFGPAEYRSEASLLIGTDRIVDGVLGQGGGFEEPERRMATEIEIIEGRVVASRAAEQLAETGWDEPAEELAERVEAAPRGFSRAIEIVGRDEDPARARELTDAFVTAYLDYRREGQVAELAQIEEDLVERLADAEGELETLDTQLAAGENVDGTREVALERYQTTATWLEEVRLLQSGVDSGVEVLSAASAPEEQTGEFPVPAAAALSLGGALLLAVGLALLLDLVRDAVRTREEAERLVQAPILAEVTRPAKGPGARARVLADPGSPTMAAARALRLRLEAGADGVMPRRVLVAGGPEDAEDHHLVGAALAAACGRAGRTTLLAADSTSQLGLTPLPEPAPGDSARRDIDHANAPLARLSALPNVWSCPVSSGVNEGSGSAGLLDGFTPAQALEELCRDFDVVVLVPPMDADVFELTSLRRLVDAFALVCSLGRTPGRPLRRMVRTLENNDARIDGLVLTSGGRRAPAKSSRDPARSDEGRPGHDARPPTVARSS